MAKGKELLSSLQIILAIRDARSTSGSERHLLNALALRVNAKKWGDYHCYPSYEALADDLQLNIYTIKRAARNLEKAGYLKRRVRKNRSNIYLLAVDKLVTEAEAKNAARKARRLQIEGSLALTDFPAEADNEDEPSDEYEDLSPANSFERRSL